MTSISDYYYYYIKFIHKICILSMCYLLFTNHQIESVLFILLNITANKSFYVSSRSYIILAFFILIFSFLKQTIPIKIENQSFISNGLSYLNII